VSNTIDLLRDDAHYYGEAGKKYLSNSDIGVLLTNPKLFGVERPDSKNFMEGRYFHQSILEPEKAMATPFIEASTRNTKIYKDFIDFCQLDFCLLKHEMDEIDYIVTQRATSSAQMNVHQQHAAVLREESRVKLKEAESAEAFLRDRNAAELQIILAEAKRAKIEGEISESEYGRALMYLERAIKSIGSGLGAAVGGFLGSRFGRGSTGIRGRPSGLGLR